MPLPLHRHLLKVQSDKTESSTKSWFPFIRDFCILSNPWASAELRTRFATSEKGVLSTAYVSYIIQLSISCSENQDTLLHVIVKFILLLPIYPQNLCSQVTRGETVFFCKLEWEKQILFHVDKLSHKSDLSTFWLACSEQTPASGRYGGNHSHGWHIDKNRKNTSKI